jgi:hypothetical protein
VWAVVFLGLDRLLERGDDARPAAWAGLGVLVGLGLLNKLSVVYLGLGLAVGLLAGPARRRLASPGPWIAVGVAALLFLPHVAWQVAHDWPTSEFVAHAKQYKIEPIGPLAFLGQNVLDMLPPSALVWLAGLGGLLFWGRLRERRWMGVAFVTIALFLVLQRSKPYYLYPAFPPLFAGGAVAWEALTIDRRGRRWARPLLVGVIALLGAATSPMAIPVLSPEGLAAWQQTLGITPSQAERSEVAEFSQHLADRFGWKELTDAVHEVWAALPGAERTSCLLIARNYGEAGALLYFGRERGLPPATSGHNSFFLWGPGTDRADVVITVGFEPDELSDTFEEVRLAARSTAAWSMPFERDVPIVVARGWKRPLAEVWGEIKLYI